MIRVRTLGLALVAVFAMGAVAASSASAASTNNPQWRYCHNVGAGKGLFTNASCTTSGTGEFELATLGAGESKEITAVQNGVQKLNVGGEFGATIECSKLKVAAGAKILGSTAPAAGTDEEVIVYEECKVVGKPLCKINGEESGKAKIKTELLKSTLVFETKAAAEAEKPPTLTLFEPKTAANFVVLKLTGTCPPGGETFEIKGQVAVKDLPATGEPHLETNELEAPAVAIKEYFINKGGVTEKKAVTPLKFGLFSATYEGKARITLVSKEFWWVFN
jgi:hypothetical protein